MLHVFFKQAFNFWWVGNTYVCEGVLVEIVASFLESMIYEAAELTMK